MAYLGRIRSGVAFSLSKLCIWLILVFALWFQFFNKGWNNERVIEHDVISYYAYLPAVFIYNDLTLRFIDVSPSEYNTKFWPSKTPEGNYVIKTTMGMSFLYSPFFFVAHLLAENLGYEPTGFSVPYRFAISMAVLFYLLMGLLILRKLLLRHFSDFTTAITLILVTWGTNLVWYATIEPGMTHVYSFTLFVFFVYLLERWFDKPTLTNSILIGLLSGIISLVRPTNALIGILVLVWGVVSFGDFKQRILLLTARWPMMVAIVLSAIVVWLPQLLYWKMQTGYYFFNSYGEEGFFFQSPQIFNGLFSYRKGWLVYTPVMLFAIIGFFFLHKYAEGKTKAILVFMVLNLYVIFSWWSWWYGGSYGARALIESYSLLAFPLAAFVHWALRLKGVKKAGILLILALFLFHSIFQTFQYYHGAIHWDSMGKTTYWASFGRLRPMTGFYEAIEPPDYAKAMQGIQATVKREKPQFLTIKKIVADMELVDSTGKNIISQDGSLMLLHSGARISSKAFEGSYSLKLNRRNIPYVSGQVPVKPGQRWLVSVKRKAHRSNGILALTGEDGRHFYQDIRIGPTSGVQGWDSLSLLVTIPETDISHLRVVLQSTGWLNVWFDNLSIQQVE
ncbi:MAG TPA: hypothetical protein DCM62_05905 [Bacteroidales bacterium]|nr:hypothetical protein [Bacteroidales bacterium]